VAPELARYRLGPSGENTNDSQRDRNEVARGVRVRGKTSSPSGVLSTAQSHTHFLDSPRMAGVLGRSTADLRALKRDRMTLYLVLPAERLDGYGRWLRVMIACGLLAIARTPGQPDERVLFLLAVCGLPASPRRSRSLEKWRAFELNLAEPFRPR
jgi:type IV secretory pathway TraG/TraD family ATPase VirD4